MTEQCQECNGTGEIWWEKHDPTYRKETPDIGTATCPDCEGYGTLEEEEEDK